MKCHSRGNLHIRTPVVAIFRLIQLLEATSASRIVPRSDKRVGLKVEVTLGHDAFSKKLGMIHDSWNDVDSHDKHPWDFGEERRPESVSQSSDCPGSGPASEVLELE